MADDHDQATKQPNHPGQRVPFTRRRQGDNLAMSLQEQERSNPSSSSAAAAFTATLETIESENDNDQNHETNTNPANYITSEESSYDYDHEDYEFFFEANGFEAELGFLDNDNDEDEDMEEYDDDEEDDELDVDELTYEELIALGEFIGVEERGLSLNEISSCLNPVIGKSSINHPREITGNGIDRCVICQIEYEDGESLVELPCEHPYHSDCISKWLQIKKCCPICSYEVSSSSSSSSSNNKNNVNNTC